MSKKPKPAKGRRKSKAEAMTGAKAGAVEKRGGDLGLPEPVMIDSGDFQLHFKAIKAATEKKDTANNLLRGCYKAANKLNPHLGDAIKAAISIERDGDAAKVKAKLEVFGIALKETGCPIQLNVFDTLLGDAVDQAYKRGEADARAGKSADNRYPVGSDLADAYTDGWQHGIAHNVGLDEQQTEQVLGKKWPDDTDVEDDEKTPPPPQAETRELAGADA